MKIYAYILIVLSGVLTAQCSKVTLDEICGYPSAPGGGNGEGEGNGDYTSYWYYSYEAAQLIDAETLGMETAEDFTPYTVAHLGDTLFIANIGKAGSSLLLFSIKKGERLGTLQSWQHDGGEKSFGSQIEAIGTSQGCLLLWCQSIIQILVDTEEQTVIDRIPHGAVWLYFLYAGCINCR